MWEDDNDKRVARSQAIGLALMTLLLVFGLQYVFPSRPPEPQPTEQTTQQASDSLQALPPGSAPATTSVAPGLPPLPPAEVIDSITDVTLDNESLTMVFTPVGARLKQATLKVDHVELVPDRGVPDTEAIFPLGLRFSSPAVLDELDRRLFTVESQDDRSVTFALTLPDSAVVRKTFTLTDSPHVIDVAVAYQNTSAERQVLGRDDGTPAYILNWGPKVDNPVQNGAPASLIWNDNGETTYLYTSKFATDVPGPPEANLVTDLDWVALKSAYFLAAFKPEFEGARPWCLGDQDRYRFGVAVPRIQVEPGETISQTFRLYMGPNHEEQLVAAWPTLDETMRFFQYPQFMNWLAKLLLNLLNWFHSLIPNYGIAIILMTLLVRAVMIPLTLKQMRSMKSMQLLQPEMEAIREKYKDDPQQMQQKVMEMYRERGVNPLGGCFPVLLQMPIFFAFYRMLWYSYELYQAPFLWMKDLSAPDCLFALPAALGSLPFIGNALQCFNLLPLLNIGVMILSVRMMPVSGPTQNPQQKMLMTFMPVVFGLICYNFASGLNLYILVSTVVGILQNRLVKVSAEDIPDKKRARKKQNMYAAYQAKKREQKKIENKKKQGSK